MPPVKYVELILQHEKDWAHVHGKMIHQILFGRTIQRLVVVMWCHL
jgi:hypothetical protein